MYACSIVRGGRASATRFAIDMRKASRMHLEGSVPTTLGSGGRFEDEDIDLFEIRDSEMTRSRSARLTTVFVTATSLAYSAHTPFFMAPTCPTRVPVTSPESVLVMLPPGPQRPIDHTRNIRSLFVSRRKIVYKPCVRFPFLSNRTIITICLRSTSYTTSSSRIADSSFRMTSTPQKR